jgi:hypothetical protein
MNKNQIIDTILNAGLSLAEHENMSLDTKGPALDNHFTIIGGKRRVELYTNGTVYANKKARYYKSFKLKGTPINESIKIAIQVALTGE